MYTYKNMGYVYVVHVVRAGVTQFVSTWFNTCADNCKFLNKSKEIISLLNHEKSEKHPLQILKSRYYFIRAETCTKK